VLPGFLLPGVPHLGHKMVIDESLWHQQQGPSTHMLIPHIWAYSVIGRVTAATVARIGPRYTQVAAGSTRRTASTLGRTFSLYTSTAVDPTAMASVELVIVRLAGDVRKRRCPRSRRSAKVLTESTLRASRHEKNRSLKRFVGHRSAIREF
jgi:hypothetical protein